MVLVCNIFHDFLNRSVFRTTARNFTKFEIWLIFAMTWRFLHFDVNHSKVGAAMLHFVRFFLKLYLQKQCTEFHQDSDAVSPWHVLKFFLTFWCKLFNILRRYGAYFCHFCSSIISRTNSWVLILQRIQIAMLFEDYSMR